MTSRDLSPSRPGRSPWGTESGAWCLSVGNYSPAQVGALQRGGVCSKHQESCPSNTSRGLLRLTAGLPEVSQRDASFLWGDGWRQPALER